MNKKRCLYCYQQLGKGEKDFHEACSLRFFGTKVPPLLEYSNEQMKELASDIVLRSISVTGVQPKLSLTIEKKPGDPKQSRLTIVGLWGNFILKPPSEDYQHLPENEDLTMHLGTIFGIDTAEHSLIRLKSGELAYITKRFDRSNGEKLALEDMCQLTETLTSDKYRGSMEKIGRQINLHSTAPGLDILRFFEMSLFCFLTGNADMHLKNFSLLTTDTGQVRLSPAYDMLCTKLVLSDDQEETALTIGARKRKLYRKDFDAFGKHLRITEKIQERIYEKFQNRLNTAESQVDSSFLPDPQKKLYKEMLVRNAEKLELL